MLTLYIVSAAVAGVLVLLSALGAGHGIEHEVHFDHSGHETETSHGHWVPFFSLRFYSYFFAGLGATGLLISMLTATDPRVTLWIAIAVGLIAGLSISIMVRVLKLNESSSGAKENDILGREAQVLVPIKGTTPGRIRCVVKGESIDFIAVCDDSVPIEAGSSVIIVAIEEGRALVMPREVLYTDDPFRLRTS